MAYGIGSVIGDIDQKVDTYRNNPEALAQMYQQNQQLIDLLALQKLKTEKEAAMRDMQMKMQTPAASIKDQREQEVMGMMRNEVAQQVAPGLQVAGQQAAQAAAPPVPQGGGLQSLPAPNMQGMGMAEGGIVAFADGGKTGGRDVDNSVVGYNPDGTPITRADYERALFALEQKYTADRRVNRPVEETLARGIYRGADNAREYSISDLSDAITASEKGRSANRARGQDELSALDALRGDSGSSAIRAPSTYVQSNPSPSYGANQARTQDEVAGLQALLSGGEGGGALSTFERGKRESHRSFPARDRAHRSVPNVLELLESPEEKYVQLMENPESRLTEAQKQLEAAKRMGLIPDERAQAATQAAPQAAQPATPETGDTEANVMEMLEENIRPTTSSSVSQAAPQADPPTAGISTLPKNQTPPAGIELSEEGLNAVLNISSKAVKQAPPEVQNEYTRRLGELRGEQESKLEALIAFLQGAGGKTSFAATMSGGAAGMNAREQRIEDEIMATVDKIEGLKLKEREFGISEEKNAIDREGNKLQAAASRYNADRNFEAAMAAVSKVTPQDITDQDKRANTYVEAARVHGDTRPDAVIRHEHFEEEANRAAAAAADRLGITSEQQRQKLDLEIYEKAANIVNANPVNAGLTFEARTALIERTREQIAKALKGIDDPAPTQQNSGATPADPNDPVGEFYYGPK